MVADRFGVHQTIILLVCVLLGACGNDERSKGIHHPLTKNDFVGNAYFGTVPIAHLRTPSKQTNTPSDCHEKVDVLGASELGAEYGLLRGFDRSHSYVFHPYEGDSKTPPLFVFYNGGPFSATTATLLPGGTAPYTATWDGKALERPQKNPASWADMGHLLYWDGSDVGLGFIETSNRASVQAPYLSDSLNAIITLLRFIQCHQIRNDTPVIFVAESYGAFRSYDMRTILAAILSKDEDAFVNWLSNRGKQPREILESLAQTTYQEVQAHFDALSPAFLDADTRVASLFPGQVLIQPGLWMTIDPKLIANLTGEADTGEPLDERPPPIYFSMIRQHLLGESSHLFWGASLRSSEQESYRKTWLIPVSQTDSHWTETPSLGEIHALSKSSGTFLTVAQHDGTVKTTLFRDALGLAENADGEWQKANTEDSPIFVQRSYNARHAVSLYQPQKLHDDVKIWLSKMP